MIKSKKLCALAMVLTLAVPTIANAATKKVPFHSGICQQVLN